MTNGDKRGAALLIMGAAVLWGLIGPFSVWAAREGMSAAETAFWRTALSAVPFALLARRLVRPARDLAGVAAFGVAGIAVMYVAFFTAVQRSGAGIAAVLLYTGPAWVALYEWGARRQRPSGTSLFALILTITGVVLVSYVPGVSGAVDRGGIAAGLLSGISFATHFTIGRKYFARHGAPAVFAVAMVAAAVAIAPLARPTLPSAGAWAPLLFLSLVATFIASLLFARGVVQVTPVRASITSTIEPVVAVVASIVVLNANFHQQQLVGAVLVLAGVGIIVMTGAGRA